MPSDPTYSGLPPVSKTIVWGSSGHAKVLRPIIERMGLTIIAMIDRDEKAISTISGCPLFHSLEELLPQLQIGVDNAIGFAIAIGGDRGRDRLAYHQRLTSHGLSPITLLHVSAWVADTARLGEGAQVLGMAAVSEEVVIGRQTIVNTNASVDHETAIGDGCHIMPGATLAGAVVVGDFCTIGSNATVFPRVRIGTGACVGAGSVVRKDVPENAVVVGVPARIHRMRR